MAVSLASIVYTFGWRWDHLTAPALGSLWFYVFPAYARRWTRRGALVTLLILLGYGNIKYLLLALLWLYPREV